MWTAPTLAMFLKVSSSKNVLKYMYLKNPKCGIAYYYLISFLRGFIEQSDYWLLYAPMRQPNTYHSVCSLDVCSEQESLCHQALSQVTRITGKQTLRSLSLSCPKKDWQAGVQNIICDGSRVIFYSRCHTQRRMGTTLRSVFSWCASGIYFSRVMDCIG